MAQVLVLVEQRNGKIAKTTYELLTLARRLGDPVAVVLGGAGAALAPALGRYGAARVVVVEDPALTEFLVTPKADALAQIAAQTDPGAVLISSSAEGREIAGRLAVKLESGLITDAVDMRRGLLDPAERVRRQLDRARAGHQAPAGGHGQAECADAGGVAGRAGS